MNALLSESSVDLLTARQIVAAALASGLADPRSPLALRCEAADLQIIEWAWRRMADDFEEQNSHKLGLGERHPCEASPTPLVKWLSLPIARRERVHQTVFGLVIATLCPPYETEYCAWKDTTHRSQELADIGGFYRAFGVAPAREAPERVDHISLEVEFIALLLEKSRDASMHSDGAHLSICNDARAAFLKDHGAWWIPTFGRLLEKRANHLCESNPEIATDLRLVSGIACMLCAWIAIERALVGIEPSRRIVTASIAPQDADDNCGACGSCAEKAHHESPPSNISS